MSMRKWQKYARNIVTGAINEHSLDMSKQVQYRWMIEILATRCSEMESIIRSVRAVASQYGDSAGSLELVNVLDEVLEALWS